MKGQWNERCINRTTEKRNVPETVKTVSRKIIKIIVPKNEEEEEEEKKRLRQISNEKTPIYIKISEHRWPKRRRISIKREKSQYPREKAKEKEEGGRRGERRNGGEEKQRQKEVS